MRVGKPPCSRDGRTTMTKSAFDGIRTRDLHCDRVASYALLYKGVDF
jgi:hypothetical protein